MPISARFGLRRQFPRHRIIRRQVDLLQAGKANFVNFVLRVHRRGLPNRTTVMFRRVSSSRSSSRTSNCRPPSRCPLRAPSAPHSDGRKLRHFCTVCAWAMYIKPHHRSIFFAHGVATLALFIALAAFYRNSPGVSAFYQLAINLVIFALCVRFRRLLNYTTFRSIRSSARSR